MPLEAHVSLVRPGWIFLSSERILSLKRLRSSGDNTAIILCMNNNLCISNYLSSHEGNKGMQVRLMGQCNVNATELQYDNCEQSYLKEWLPIIIITWVFNQYLSVLTCYSLWLQARHFLSVFLGPPSSGTSRTHNEVSQTSVSPSNGFHWSAWVKSYWNQKKGQYKRCRDETKCINLWTYIMFCI